MIQKIAVIGGGLMGTQIALYFANYGYEVILIYRNENGLKKGKDRITSLVQNSFWKRNLNPGYKLIHSLGLNSVTNCDLIIESIDENLKEKEKLYQSLCTLISNKQIVASNSSVIPIEKMLPPSTTGNYINLHFFNPLINSKSVEIAFSNSIYAKETIMKLCADTGLKTLLVENNAGFCINKIVMPFWIDAINEFSQLNIEASEFDACFKSCLGHKAGPLETIDLIGVEVFAQCSDLLFEMTGDARYKKPEMIEKIIADKNTDESIYRIRKK